MIEEQNAGGALQPVPTRPADHYGLASGNDEGSPAPASMPELIDRYTRDPTIDVEKFERVLAMWERREAHEAELAFNAAKGRILADLESVKIVKRKSVQYPVEKNNPKAGTQEAFKYAPLEDIDKVMRPLLVRENMDLAYSDEAMADGRIMIRGRLKHLPKGHYEDSFMAAPLDTSGGKNNVQAVGSTNSYLRRYLACNLFNIVVIGDDDDGTGGTIDEAQAAYIRKLIEQVQKIDPRKDEAAFCKFMHVQSIKSIAFREYRKATAALEERIKDANPAS